MVQGCFGAYAQGKSQQAREEAIKSKGALPLLQMKADGRRSPVITCGANLLESRGGPEDQVCARIP